MFISDPHRGVIFHAVRGNRCYVGAAPTRFRAAPARGRERPVRKPRGYRLRLPAVSLGERPRAVGVVADTSD